MASTHPKEVPNELTAAWLDAALRSANLIAHTRVVGFTASPPGQTGATGRLLRVTPLYDGDEPSGPTTLIAKFAAEAGPALDLARWFRLYEREARFYAGVAPLAHIRTPALYSVGRDANEDPILLLEDLAPARTGDVVTGCSVEVIAPLIEKLAKTHAAYWSEASEITGGGIPQPNDPITVAFSLENFAPAWDGFRQRLTGLPAAVIEAGERLCGDRSVLDRLSNQPRTLTHGDLRLNNMMFDEENRVIAVLDWQSVTLARGPMDLASLLVTNLHPDDCALAEADLLPEYHQTLVNLGIRGYSLAECQVDYRLASLALFAQVVMLSSFLDLGNQNATTAAIIGRPLAAVERFDATKLLNAKPFPTRLLRRVRPAARRLRDKLSPG